MNPYFTDILGQPAALRLCIKQFPHPVIDQIKGQMLKRQFDRIVLTGMGASFNAAYPAFIHLTGMPIPVSHLNSAELSHFQKGILGNKTLLWLNSQSGRSVEILNIIEHIKSNPVACSLSFVNDSSSVEAVFKSEKYDWVTLLTCENFNAINDGYQNRRIVRAVLVTVE